MIAACAIVALTLAQGPAADSTLRLPLRVHLLHSPMSQAVSTTRTAATVDTMVAFANAIWHQAAIVWVVESIVQEDAPNGRLLDSLIASPAYVTPERLADFIPRDRLLTPGWNLFLIQDFGPIAGGAFLPVLGVVILAERGYGYDLPANGRGGGTLAHELGHSLTLPHQPCDSTRNIMANACSRAGVVSTLTAAQIDMARRQATAGRPTSATPTP